MRRILVGGISGSGKTTLGRRIASALDLSFVELDALFHGPGWVPRDEFEADVDAATAGDAWVVDSHGYPQVRDQLWSRADTVVWLDYSRPVVMGRVLRRSFARATYDRELWNQNREGFADWRHPSHPVRWAWTQHRPRHTEIADRLADPRWGRITVVRLGSPRAARRWLAGLGDASTR